MLGTVGRCTRGRQLPACLTRTKSEKDPTSRSQTPPSNSVHSISHAWVAKKAVIQSRGQPEHLESEEAQPCMNSSIRYSQPSNALSVSAPSSKRAVRDRQCQLQQLLSIFHRHCCTRRRRRRRHFR